MKKIAVAINKPVAAANYALTNGSYPGRKLGGKWIRENDAPVDSPNAIGDQVRRVVRFMTV